MEITIKLQSRVELDAVIGGLEMLAEMLSDAYRNDESQEGREEMRKVAAARALLGRIA